MPKQCPSCHISNRDDARFCYNCATPLVSEISCPSCGTANPLQARFCHYCATPLKGGVSQSTVQQQTGLLQPNTALSNRYIILSKVGGGGMAAVYQAIDQRLQGKVWAVKEMSDAAITGALERQQAVDAFRQEAQLLATLDHSGLPKVSDYFTDSNKHYLVLDFIQGRTLETVLAEATGFLTEAEVINWVKQLGDVLTYLHNRQPPIIFRDLKPDNIMLDDEGRIKLIDFGIVRLFQPGKSQDTQLLGTPGFAALEQYGTGQTDTRTDIYALGVTLHRLLTGYDPALTPFSLPPARSLNPALSPATEAVIVRATQSDMAARFQSIDEMKQALLRPAGVTNPRPAVSPTEFPGQPKILPPATFPISPQNVAQVVELKSTRLGENSISQIAWSPNGEQLAIATPDGVCLYDSELMTKVNFLETNAEALSVVFSPDGSILASGLTNGAIWLWQETDWALLDILVRHQYDVWSVAFSPDGMLLASGAGDKRVILWDIDKNQLIRILKGHKEEVLSVAFSPNRTLLASGAQDGIVRLWRVPDGKTEAILREHKNWVQCVAFSSSGTILASGSEGRTIWLRRIADGMNTLIDHTHRVLSMDFSPNEELLVSGSNEGIIQLWQVSNTKLLCTLTKHKDEMMSVLFSPDGKRLASAATDGTIRLWGLKN